MKKGGNKKPKLNEPSKQSTEAESSSSRRKMSIRWKSTDFLRHLSSERPKPNIQLGWNDRSRNK